MVKRKIEKMINRFSYKGMDMRMGCWICVLVTVSEMILITCPSSWRKGPFLLKSKL